MSLTRINNNGGNTARNNNLASWGPLINRLTKMAIEYSKSKSNKVSSKNGVGGNFVGSQYTLADSPVRRGRRNRKPTGGRGGGGQGNYSDRTGIPHQPLIKVQTVAIRGSYIISASNGSIGRKFHLGNLSDTAFDLFQQGTAPPIPSTSYADIAFLKAFSCWKFHRLDCTFDPCVALTDGGYHVAAVSSVVDPIAAITPYEVKARPQAQMGGMRTVLKLSLTPSHNDGVVHYGESFHSDDVQEKQTGTILYYGAGGPTGNNQPLCIFSYVAYMSVWG